MLPRRWLTSRIFVLMTVLGSWTWAFAEEELPKPPDDPVEYASGACTALDIHSEQILSYWWLISAILAACIGVLIHLWVSRRVSRRWRGEQPTWGQFWAIPLIVAMMTYAIASGVLLFASGRACPRFANYLQMNFGGGHILLWVVIGSLIVFLPSLVRPLLGDGGTPSNTKVGAHHG
jgi:hypothetical protein